MGAANTPTGTVVVGVAVMCGLSVPRVRSCDMTMRPWLQSVLGLPLYNSPCCAGVCHGGTRYLDCMAPCPWWAILAVLEQYCKPCPPCREWGLANGAHLHHGMTVGAENLSLTSLSPVHGRIHGHIMGDMGGGAVGGGDKIGHAITFAVGVGGMLVETVKEHRCCLL